MEWQQLTQPDQLDKIDEESAQKAILIFKHSTRCGVSSSAKKTLEREWKENDGLLLTPYYLDLLAFRNISNAVAERYQIGHQSPQVLLIRNGKCVYSASHSDISRDALVHAVGGGD